MASMLFDLLAFMGDWFMFGVALAIAAISAIAGIATVCAGLAAIAVIGYGAILAMQFGMMVFVEWWEGIVPFLKLSPREIMRRARRTEA